MHLRALKRTTAGGEPRHYYQLVSSYRREDGVPATKVLAHLGILDDVLADNLKAALASARHGQRVYAEAPSAEVSIQVLNAAVWLPFEVVCAIARRFGLDTLFKTVSSPGKEVVDTYRVLEALIAHRCLQPDSKLAFQDWIADTAVEEVLGVAAKQLNNSRVHRALEALADVDEKLQDAVARSRFGMRRPTLLFLDLTDTWFVAGGGSLARRGQTKEGHRSKWKIHIALLVDEEGFPLRWRLLPGALSETTVLPSWVEALHQWPELTSSVLVFDRGMPSIENFRLLTSTPLGRPFLTSVKSDSIATYVDFSKEALDALQALPADATEADIQAACEPLNLLKLDGCTYARDLGVLEPPKPANGRRTSAPAMRMYVYFNPQMRKTRREGREERMKEVAGFVSALNQELRNARQPRDRQATERKVSRLLEQKKLCELYEVHLDEHLVAGRTKPIGSWQVTLKLREDMLSNARRYDGITLLAGHPLLELPIAQAISAYRHKATIESDFRTIKSVLNLRPTFHRSDEKIQAHVTLCVLALLVERLIEAKLRTSTAPDCPATADALFGELAPVRLTKVRIGQKTHALRVTATDRVRALLAALELDHLLDKFSPALKPTPRPELEV